MIISYVFRIVNTFFVFLEVFMFLTKFPLKLKELLRDNNISQKQLADKLKTSQPTVNRWIKGENEPNLKTLMLICEILNTTPNYILGYEDSESYMPYGLKVEEILQDGESPMFEKPILIPARTGNREINAGIVYEEDTLKRYIREVIKEEKKTDTE